MPVYRADRRLKWKAQVRDEAGRLKSKSFATEKHARKWEIEQADVRQLVREGMARPMLKIIFYDWICAWLLERERSEKASSFIPQARMVRQILVPAWANRGMHTIMREEIEDLLDDLVENGPPDTRPVYTGDELVVKQWRKKAGEKKGRPPKPWSPATRNRLLALIHKIFEDARTSRQPVIKENPASGIEMLDETSRKAVVLKDEAQARLYIDKMYEQGSVFGVGAELLVYTGARISNILAAQWKSVRPDDKGITFGSIVERATGNVEQRTKGEDEGGFYETVLVPQLERALNEWRGKTPHPLPDDFILALEDGRHLTYDIFEHRHHKALEAAGLPRLNLHDIRHFFSTVLKNLGLTLAERQELLGHKSEKMTERYTHKDMSHLAKRLAEVGFGKVGG